MVEVACPRCCRRARLDQLFLAGEDMTRWQPGGLERDRCAAGAALGAGPDRGRERPTGADELRPSRSHRVIERSRA
ncbi:hypothetical protein [Saccharopolyspora hordei]|uniref:Uncharacterized protein n=1 Tax=Saccharopolyspora hordei TaxID=1838 RepID=A0A853AU78_9PSEU|nr:hypothetical protein [Saccharopolyspora hordei]NYI86191.1 hypothetical protein [Saccharopolyspora hordei]